MLRTPVSKWNSIRVITVLVALILMATIWPLRLYHETISYSGGAVTEISEDVTATEDAGEYFTAQYDHLDSVEVYIESAAQGEYFTASVYDPQNNNERLAHEKVAFPDEDLPGYVTIPMDIDLEPGTIYILIVSGAVRKEDDAVFRVGYESAVEALENPNAPIYNVAFHNDTGISGLALAMRTHYVEPLTKTKSAVAAGLIWVLAMVAVFLESLYVRRHPKADRLIPLLTVLRYTLTPVIVIPAVIGVIAVFPLRLYDSRVLDVLIYEAGIVLAAGYFLYLLWRDHTGLPEVFESGADALSHLPQILMALDVAWIVQNACTYMNAVNDYTHHDCEARIVIGLALLILLLGRLSWNLNVWTVLTAIVGAVLCGVHVRSSYMLLVSEGMNEIPERMANITGQAVSYAFLAVAAMSVLVMLLSVWRERRHHGHAGQMAQTGRFGRGLSVVSGILVAAFFLLTAICRNGRDWLLLLAVVWGLLYLRYAFSSMRQTPGSWLRVIAYGVILQFLCNVVWTMLHRYYLAYNFSRFSMQFHTVTITAYYLLMVAACALSLFLMQLRAVYELPLRERLRRLAPQIGILGAVSSYMVMSMTRAGVYSLAAMVLVGLFATFVYCRPASVRRMLHGLGAIILVFVLSFPSIYTGQRIVSTTAASPVIYEMIEEYPYAVLHHAPWNSTEFMNIEIFLRDSLDRLAGGGIGSQIYYRLKWNIPQGYDVASLDVTADDNAWMTANGIVAGPLTASAGDAAITNEDGSVTDEILDSITTGNYTGNGLSNGRSEIWKEYLSRMNMTGHEGMDIEMPNGEIAIHAHNILVQMMYDCGIPAGVLFVALLFVVVVGAAVYYRRHSGESTALMPLLLSMGFVLTGMVEWIYQFDNPYTIMILLIVAPILFKEKAQ